MYNIQENDVREISYWLQVAQENLNLLFEKEQLRNELPESVLVICKALGRVSAKIEKVRE